MIALTLGLSDLASLRFAYSPIQEAVQSLWAWSYPEKTPEHASWRRAEGAKLEQLDWPLLRALVGPHGWIPDFLTPYPTTEAPSFQTELDLVRSTDPDRVRLDLLAIYRADDAFGELPPVLADCDRNPAALRDAISDTFQDYWDLLLAPHWPLLRDVLDADIAYRSRQLATGGANALFADLDSRLRWVEGRVEVEAHGIEVDEHVDGRGLVLTPSLFASYANTMIDSELPPMISYPARGRALLWHAPQRSPAAVAALIGATRAEILVALAEPATTTQLAARLALTPGGVSQHLTALRRTGLLRRTRVARVVTYEQTALAVALIRAADPAG